MIIGSGPAGVSAALPLVQAGIRVLMIDGGKHAEIQPPKVDFISSRQADLHQWRWILGSDFYALKLRDAVSPKFRAPTQAYAFQGFGSENRIRGRGFVAAGSLATGGLSNSWGCGVARFSGRDINAFPFPVSELRQSYAVIEARIGISGGGADDLSEYFGVDEYAQPPIQMDALHTRLYERYAGRRPKLERYGFKLGRSRLAVLSQNRADRQACNRSGNCLWGCQRRSMYSSLEDLSTLGRYGTFSHQAGFVVDQLKNHGDIWMVEGRNITDGRVMKPVTGRQIVLAAGTLATTRIVLSTLNHKDPVPLLSCPTAAFLIWLPQLLGTPHTSTISLGQLSYSLVLRDDVTAFGSTFATTGIPMFEFASHVPLRRRYGIDVLSALLSSCAVGNLFLPGHLTAAEARLGHDGYLSVSGSYCDGVASLMDEAAKKLRRAYWQLGAVVVPASFKIGTPGSDVHYAGTLPMRSSPALAETSPQGEVAGLRGVFVVDGACLPVLPEKSHTLTIMANADRIGRHIARQATPGH